MLKSFIDPKKIIGTGTGVTNPGAFSNFMLGNNSAVSDTVGNSPSNNITKFSRESGVKAANSNLQSIISNISQNISNIFNNNLENIKSEIKTTNDIVQSQIKNISNNIIKNVNNIVDNKITTLKTEIENQIQNISKSNKELNNSSDTISNISSVNSVDNTKEIENQIQNISKSNKEVNSIVDNKITTLKTEIENQIQDISKSNIEVNNIVDNKITTLKTEIENQIQDISKSNIEVNNIVDNKSNISSVNSVDNTKEIENQIQDISKSNIEVNNIVDNKITTLKTEIENQIQNISKSNKEVNSVENTKEIENQIENVSNNIIKSTQTSVSNIINSSKTEIQKVTEGIQSQVQTTLTNLIQNFTKDYQQKIQSKEDNKPSNILKGFLGLYQNAINFVTFFGDSKNNKRIEKSLKSLRNMFNDSFNTALIIRQTIVKIVKQLSNLPTASGASGGLNLDVKVPGGPLKQVGGSTIGKLVKGGTGKLLGAGVAGAGLGLMGMQAAKASQEEKLAETAKKDMVDKDKSNDFMEGLNNIIERFSDAINSLLGGSKKDSTGGDSSGGDSSSGGGEAGTGTGEGATGEGATGAGAGAAPDVSSSPGDLKLAGFLSTLESTGNQNQADVLQSIINRTSQNYSGYGGLGAQITAREQYSPISAAIYSTSGDKNASGAYGKIAQKLGKTPAGRIQKLQQIASQPDGLQQLQQLFGAGSAADAARVINDFQTNGTLSKSSADFVKGRTDFGATSGVGGAQGSGQISRNGGGANVFGGAGSKRPAASLTKIGLSSSTPSIVTPQAAQKPPSAVKPALPSTSKVEPAPQKPKAQEVSQAVTTPPGQDNGKDVKVATASLPPDITVIPGGGSQDGGAVAALPPPSFDKPDVSEYGESINPNNPYWSLPFRLGILNA